MKSALVIGGGIGGVEAAIALRKQGLPVTLVSDRAFLFNYPVSIWIPTREVEFDKVAIPLGKLAAAHGFEVVIDQVAALHPEASRVSLASGKELAYDHLVMAIGADKVKHPGVEHTISTCGKPEDALRLRDRLDELIAKGSGRIAVGFGGNPKDQSAVRGGPAFELLFNIDNLLDRKGLKQKFELAFFAPMPKPGARMGGRAAVAVLARLGQMGWKVHTGKKIEGFSAEGVTFEDDSFLGADLTVWVPAGTGKPLFREAGLPVNEAGFIRIDDHCQVEGFESIYAIGDAAALQGPEWRAKQGHIAEVMARTAAFNIAAAQRGSAERKGYQEHVNILCVMDTGKGANFVYRSSRREMAVPLPILGHTMKKAWGVYYTLSKLKRIPRLPGM